MDSGEGSSDASDRKVYIKVTSPTTPCPSDHIFALDASLTIIDLKHEITRVIDPFATTDRQRLIFGGRVLNEKCVLGNVIKAYTPETKATVHLVVTPSATASTTITSTTSATTAPTRAASEPSQPTPSHAAPPQPPILPPTIAINIPGIPDGTPINVETTPHTYRYILLNGAPYLLQLPPRTPNVIPVVGPDGSSYLLLSPAATEVVDSGSVRLGRRIRGLGMRGLGREEAWRRLRAHAGQVWLVLRLGFMLALFSQGAGWGKFVTLLLSACVIFFWQTGILAYLEEEGQGENGARPVVAEHREHPAGPAQGPAAQPQEAQTPAPTAAAPATPTPTAGAAAAAPVAHEQVTIFEMLKQITILFFTSLIPGPEVVPPGFVGEPVAREA
ncbi:hypothetical protein YB2330_000366 [Saitoella coloradoensis]